jgi:hypothetical protein
VIVISVAILAVGIGFLPEKPYWARQIDTRLISMLIWGITGAWNAEILVLVRRRVFSEPDYALGQVAHIVCIFLGGVPELMVVVAIMGLGSLLR